MDNFIQLAYIDPMSGAVVFQLIIAFIAGTTAFFRKTILGSIKRVFGGAPQSESAN